MQTWKVLASKDLVKNRWITVRKQEIDTGQGIIPDFYLVSKSEYVIIVAEHDGRILFLNQYRHGAGKAVLNLPMGIIEKGETPLACAKRELLEETGYRARKFTSLGHVHSSPGYITDVGHIFFADDAIKVQEATEKAEVAELILIPIHNIRMRLQDMDDMQTLSAIFLAEQKKVWAL